MVSLKSCLCVRVKFQHIRGGRKLVFLQFFKSTRRSYEYCQRLFLTASHLLTYCTKKIADNFFISSLDRILPPLLGNKAHLYEVENSPGSSFCSAAVLSVIFHTAGSRCCPFPIYHLFPLLQLVLCPSSIIRPLNHSDHMLIPNYLKGKKKKKKSAAHVLSLEPLLVVGQTKAHPSLTFVLLKTIPVLPALPMPPPLTHGSPGSCQSPYSLRNPTNRKHPPAPG